MIYGPSTFATSQTDLPLQSGATLSEDGQALVGDIINGVYGVKPSTGAAGEKFVGFLRAQTSAVPFVRTSAVKVEQETLGAGGTFQLAKIPVGGTISAYNVTDGAAIAGGSLSVSGTGLATVTGGANKTIRFTYTYLLTVEEARSISGDVQPGGFSGNSYEQAPTMKGGTIYMTMFDTAVQWEDATGVKLAAGGKVTDQSGSGVALTNVNIVAIPTVDSPYLGLSFIAA